MKHILRIIIIAIFALGVSVGLWMYMNGYLLKSKASETIAHLAFSTKVTQANVGDVVKVALTVTTDSAMSGIDVSFDNTGSNLDFLFPESTANLPLGFDERILDESTMTTTRTDGSKALKRIVYVAKKTSTLLQRSTVIPLYFKVVSGGQSTIGSSIAVNMSSTQVVGPKIPGNLFTLQGDRSPLDFSVQSADPRAASVTNLTCDSSCGRNVILKWSDSSNETGYRILKNGQPLAALGQNSTSYLYNWCADFGVNNYAVIAYNGNGSVSATTPAIDCACQVCPTQTPPTPTPILPTISADLIFRLNFPDVAQNVSQIPNVKVTILDNNGNRICLDDNDCAQVVTFTRIDNVNFKSPQLQYNLKKNQAYRVVVKQEHTVQRVYGNVYLKWQKVLQCLNNTTDSGCGDLIHGVDARPMLSGDMNGLDPKTPGFNIINVDDLTRVGTISDAQNASGVKSAEGDMNFDGGTDVKDYGIVAKNLNKQGD